MLYSLMNTRLLKTIRSILPSRIAYLETPQSTFDHFVKHNLARKVNGFFLV